MRAASIFILAAICFVVVVVVVVGQLQAAPTEEIDNKEAWRKFKEEFNKTYDSIQDVARFAKFVITLGRITAHNLLTNSTFKMGLNKFADYNETELANLFGNRNDDDSTERWRQKPGNSSQKAPGAGGALPESVDWRQVEGRVTGVKDQGQCGACWAFATAGMLEGQDKEQERDLSQQQFVDCSTSNLGCGGGWIAKAIEDIRSQGAGVELESTYPYQNTQNTCTYDKSRAAYTTSGEPMVLPKGDEQALADWVANWGPVAVSFTASDDFRSYQGGVFSDQECSSPKFKDNLNHAVLVVGYGTDQQTGTDYWLIKNSWDTWWGEQGFARLQRGVNMCNIATSAVVMQ